MPDIVLKEGVRCYGYIRVSTDRQENSPEAQSKILSEWAAQQGHPIELVYDRAVSAAKVEFEKRCGGQEILRQIQPGDVIVAVRLDRLFRRGTEVALLYRLAERNIRIITVADNLPDATTAMGKFVQGTLVLVHTLEAAIIGARIRETMAWRKSMDLPVNGRGKFGYRIVPGTRGAVFERDEEEMTLICEASDRRLKGESSRSICNDFTKRGLTTQIQDGKTGEMKSWTQERVSKVTLQYWLQNDIEPPKHAVCDRPTPEEQQQRRLERITWAQGKPVWIIHGQRCKRLKHEEEDYECVDCGVSHGMYHVPKCTEERCPLCDGRAATCDCRPRLPRKIPKRKPKPKPVKRKPGAAARLSGQARREKQFTWRDAGWTASSEPESAGSAAPTAPPLPDSPPSGPPADTGE